MPEAETHPRCQYSCISTGWKCPRPALQDSREGYCICHEQRDDKVKPLFEEKIKEILQSAEVEDCHFEGFYFPFDLDISKVVFSKNVHFDFAIFKADVDFCQAQFSGEKTSFRHCQFSGNETDFTEVQFSAIETNFIGAQFSAKETSFEKARFTGLIISFDYSKFSGDIISFGEAQFSGNETSFDGTEFSGTLTRFYKAQFSGEAIRFSNVHFSGQTIDFMATQFAAKGTYFRMAQFSGEATSFWAAKFSGEEISFDLTLFMGGTVEFSCVTVNGLLSFAGARFSCKETLWRDLVLPQSACLQFTRAVFQETSRNDMRNLDLSKCLICETNLEYCDVSLVPMNWNWKLLNESMSSETYKKHRKDASHDRFYYAADSYRRLKVNFIKRQDYGKAAICNYREWECNRRSSKFSLYKNWADFKTTLFEPTILKWPNIKSAFLTLFYLIRRAVNLLFIWGLKRSSGYGEKLQNVIITIATFFVVYPLLFIIPGFQLCPGGEGFSAAEGISQWWGASAITHWWWGFKHTLFNFFPLWRLTDLKPCTDLARLATGFVALVGAFMIGMFIYVFRRRLMR